MREKFGGVIYYSYLVGVIIKEEQVMKKQVIIKDRKVKTYKDYSVQMERIYTLSFKGYGTTMMLEKCEQFFSVIISKNGY